MTTKTTKSWRPKGNILYNQKVAPYIFVLPFVLSFLIFFAYPIFSTVIMSLQRIKGLNSVTFIGFNNYKRLLNPHFYNALKTNTIYTICIIGVLIPIPVVLATLLNVKFLRFRNFFRSALFIPSLTSVIVAGIAFRLMFSELDTGFFNSIIIAFGGEPITWNMGFASGMVMMVVLGSWRMLGVNVVYNLSALQSIPEELYEAASIDGANTIQKFFNVTLPQIKPIVTYILTVTIIDGYRMFTEGYVYWNEYNPGDLGLTIVRYIYQQAFQRNDLGMGSAIGVVLLLIILTINLIQLRYFGLFKKED